MPGVFISYRREDSAGYAGRLFDIVSARIGAENTYMDLASIEGGDDFADIIDHKIDVSDVLIAVIGDNWLTITDEDGHRRLDNAHDFVRIEIARALKRGIRVIPVLVGGAVVPLAEDLPADLMPLSERHAVEIRDAYFHSDCEKLIAVLDKALQGTGYLPGTAKVRRLLVPVVVGLAGAILLIAGVLLFRHQASSANGGRVTNSAPRTADIAGRWNATVKYDWGATYEESFDFEVDSGQVSGTAGFLGSRPGAGRAITNGTVKENRLSFTTTSLTTMGSSGPAAEDKHHYKGIVEGELIRFTLVTESTVSAHSPVHFVARKVTSR